jgi:uncharacterized protein YbjT (DUF2867 family)
MQFYLPGTPIGLDVAANALFLPMENAKLSPVVVDDIAKIAFALLGNGGHEAKGYDMTGPEAQTMTEAAERIAQAIGKTVRYVNVTLLVRWARLRSNETPHCHRLLSGRVHCRARAKGAASPGRCRPGPSGVTIAYRVIHGRIPGLRR